MASQPRSNSLSMSGPRQTQPSARRAAFHMHFRPVCCPVMAGCNQTRRRPHASRSALTRHFQYLTTCHLIQTPAVINALSCQTLLVVETERGETPRCRSEGPVCAVSCPSLRAGREGQKRPVSSSSRIGCASAITSSLTFTDGKSRFQGYMGSCQKELSNQAVPTGIS